MNVGAAVAVVAAIIALCTGLVTSVLTLMSSPAASGDSGDSGGRAENRAAANNPEPTRRRPIMLDATLYQWNFTAWTIVLGVVLMLAPQSWFGPTWAYFPQIPHNGFGMGLCLTILAGLLALALWRGAPVRIVAWLFFLNGFVYWTAGIILGAEGLLGHQGLMEAPFMLYVGVHAFAHSASLTVAAK